MDGDVISASAAVDPVDVRGGAVSWTGGVPYFVDVGPAAKKVIALVPSEVVFPVTAFARVVACTGNDLCGPWLRCSRRFRYQR